VEIPGESQVAFNYVSSADHCQQLHNTRDCSRRHLLCSRLSCNTCRLTLRVLNRSPPGNRVVLPLGALFIPRQAGEPLYTHDMTLPQYFTQGLLLFLAMAYPNQPEQDPTDPTFVALQPELSVVGYRTRCSKGYLIIEW